MALVVHVRALRQMSGLAVNAGWPELSGTGYRKRDIAANHTNRAVGWEECQDRRPP